jgi:type VII secretion protein EccB
MASRKDLVEAHAFNRRRLVTAFLGGAPGGRELEPHRPARAVLAGVVLAGLLVAGAAVAGFLRPGLPNGWNRNTLVIAKDSGARYVATGGRLFPVANTTSARLLLPADDFRVVLAPDDRIALEPRGDNLGIVGAPDTLPAADDLVQTGWTSCLDQRGRTRLRIAARPGAAPVPSSTAFVVRSGSDLMVIANGHRFAVPTATRTVTLRALGLDAVPPTVAPASWVNLFPAGPDLVPLRVPGAGSRLPPSLPAPPGASRVGTVVQVTDTAGAERPYVLVPEGLAPLSPLSAALYQVGDGSLLGVPVRVDQGAVAALPTTAGSIFPGEWPADLPTAATGPVNCALLLSGPGGRPGTALAAPSAPNGTPGTASDAVVDPAHGALVRTASAGDPNRGTVFLVDSTARRYAVGGGVAETQARLGYGHLTPAAVPPAWLEPLRDGPVLSPQAAQQAIGSAATGAGGNSPGTSG